MVKYTEISDVNNDQIELINKMDGVFLQNVMVMEHIIIIKGFIG